MSGKDWIRNSLARGLYSLGLTAPLRRNQGRLSIVTFHRVLPHGERDAYPYPGLVVTPEELDACLGYLTRHFDCGPLSQQHERFTGGSASTHPLLALTFDDAQRDNFLHARPVLARRGLRASFFVPVEAVERAELLWHDRLGFAVLDLLRAPCGHQRLERILQAAGLPGIGSGRAVDIAVDGSKRLSLDARLRLIDAVTDASGNARPPEFAALMSFDELRQLAADGHEIGSHSMSHRLMPECDESALEYELAGSRRVLQQRLGGPIDAFCYPNGDADRRCALAAARAGYRRAVTTTWGANAPGADPFLLRRYDMDARRMRDSRGLFMPALLAFRMSGFYPGLA